VREGSQQTLLKVLKTDARTVKRSMFLQLAAGGGGTTNQRASSQRTRKMKINQIADCVSRGEPPSGKVFRVGTMYAKNPNKIGTRQEYNN